MALIDEIISAIEAIPIEDGKLTLEKTTLGKIGFLKEFFDKVLKESTLTLDHVERTSGDKTIKLKGKAGLLGYKDLTLSITFDVQDEQVTGTVHAVFATDKTVTLPVINWITVGDVTFTTALTEKFSMVTFEFGVKILTSGSKRIPVTISTQGGGDWILQISGDEGHGASAKEIADLLGGGLTQFLPGDLAAALKTVELNGLETRFNISKKSISYFSAGMLYTEGWDIAPKVSLKKGLLLSLTVIKESEEATRRFIANVQGTFELGEGENKVEVPIQLGTSVGDTVVWSFGIQMGRSVVLKNLSQLLSLGNAETSLPDGLSNLPDIEITTLRVDFDSTKKEILLIAFAIRTMKTWKVIANYFEIEQLSIDFEISNLLTPADRQVFGTLFGLFRIGPVPLFCSLSKTAENPNWTIQAGLPPDSEVDIVAVGAKLFEGKIHLPEEMPVIAFSTLLLTVVPETGDVTFDAQSANAWVLIENKLSIESFNLHFNRTPEKIIGWVKTTLKIVTVNVMLEASLNNVEGGGWFFSGETKEGDEIPFGEFITYITSKFNVPDPPDWLKQLKITHIKTTLNTKKKDFTFDVTAKTTISEKPCVLIIKFSLTHDDKGKYTLVLTGDLTIGDQKFTLDFKKSEKTSLLLATWSIGSGKALELEDIARLFGNEALVNQLSNIPEGMKLSLTSLSFTYNFTPAQLVLAATSKNYGEAVFVGDKTGGSWVFCFMLAIKKVDLTQLPLIGEEVGKLGPFAIENLRLLVISGKIEKKTAEDINVLIDAAAKRVEKELPKLPVPEKELAAGVGLNMKFEVAGYTVPVEVGTAKPASSTKLLGAAQYMLVATGGGSDNVQTGNGFWINIQRAFGPVYMDKIGINYDSGKLWFLFNFSLNMGAMVLTLDGLAGGSPLSEFKPEFALQGLSLTFNTGAVQISGGFIRTRAAEGYDQYNGQALVKAGTFMIAAMGSYAKVNGETSLFIFALLSAPLGGPPAFFVTGVAAGFGYNRALKIPSIDEVPDFPLVSGFVPGKSSPFSGSDPGKALSVLVSKNIVPVQIGQNWLAAGIQFSSFEMLQSFALVAVEFGTTLEIALIGMSTASVPTGAPNPLIFAQLALLVRVLPDQGLVAVEAKLTSNSYLFSTSCQLTGGFAFYIWFGSNPAAGDFVVTLGGYHPNFVPPKYYPTVPRLGFNWVVTSELTIKGGIYFALTPRCLMAGGSLEAVWQSGNLKAWFNLGANFLIAWKPYHYEANVYINFGVSYTFNIDLLFTTVTKTISVSLGADLSIWGPEFSGVARIHLWIISFSISFGAASSRQPKPISWEDFEESFFPQKTPSGYRSRSVRRSRVDYRQLLAAGTRNTETEQDEAEVSSAKISSGLLQQLEPGESNEEKLDWIVSPQGTCIVTNSLIPAKKYELSFKGQNNTSAAYEITNQQELDDINTEFGVGPVAVDQKDLSTKHAVEFEYKGEFDPDQKFYVTAVIGKAPKAMWLDAKPDVSNETLLKKVLLGFEITTRPPDPDHLPPETPPVNAKYLDTSSSDYEPKLEWAYPDLIPGPDQPSDPIAELERTIGKSAGRDAIVNALRAGGFDVYETKDIDLSHMEKQAGDYLLAPPQFAYQYWKAS